MRKLNFIKITNSLQLGYTLSYSEEKEEANNFEKMFVEIFECFN